MIEVEEKELQPYNKTDHATSKHPRNTDKQEKEDNIGVKFVPIQQETQSEKVEARDNKEIWKNEEMKSITIK